MPSGLATGTTSISGLLAKTSGSAASPLGGGPPSLAELLDHDVTMAVCAPQVPCGAAAAKVLGAAGMSAYPDTYEDDVRAVLTKVELGEVDAGVVYRSDVVSAGDAVRSVEIPGADARPTCYRRRPGTTTTPSRSSR